MIILVENIAIQSHLIFNTMKTKEGIGYTISLVDGNIPSMNTKIEGDKIIVIDIVNSYKNIGFPAMVSINKNNDGTMSLIMHVDHSDLNFIPDVTINLEYDKTLTLVFNNGTIMIDKNA